MDLIDYWTAEFFYWLENSGNTDLSYAYMVGGGLLILILILILIRELLGWLLQTNREILLLREQNLILSDHMSILEEILSELRSQKEEDRENPTGRIESTNNTSPPPDTNRRRLLARK